MIYEVKVQRTVVTTTVVEVEARNEDYAVDKAETVAYEDPDSCRWETDSDDLDVLSVTELPDEDDEE